MAGKLNFFVIKFKFPAIGLNIFLAGFLEKLAFRITIIYNLSICTITQKYCKFGPNSSLQH